MSFSALVKSAKKKMDRHGDGSHDGKRHSDPLLHLSIKKLSKITPEQLERYSNKDLEALPQDRLQVLPAKVLSKLDPEVLDRLPGETIARLSPAAQIRLSPMALARIPIDFLASVHSDVLFHALPAIHPEDLRSSKLEKAIHRIGHEQLRQLPPEVIKRLPFGLPSEPLQLPIQGRESSMISPEKSLPPDPPQASTHNLGVSSEYLQTDAHYEQPGVVYFNAYNTANIDPSAFSSPADRSYADPPSPTHTDTGRSSPAYTPASPGPVTYADYGPPKFSEISRGVSDLGLSTPSPRLGSRTEEGLSTSEVIKRAESGNEKSREIPRKETPKTSQETFPKEDSMSPTSTSTSSPEVASLAEPTRAAQEHTTSSANDDAESDHTNQEIKDHTIKELKPERDNLNNKLINAKAEHIALLSRLTKYLDDKGQSKRHTGDPIDVVIAYCEELCEGHNENFEASKYWENRYLSEKKHREEVEDQLDDKSWELGAAEDKVVEYSKRATELETQESSLRKEIARLQRDKFELERRCENQKAHSDAAIKRIQWENEDKVAQLLQTVAEHDSQMRSQQDHYESKLRAQKEDYAQKMQDQRVYYEGQVNYLHQQLADQDQFHQTSLAQATKGLQDAITDLRSRHQQELNRVEAICDEQINTLLMDHNQKIADQQKKHEEDIQRLKQKHARNVVGLREKVQSLENDLVGNNDDFRPATDDSLKIQYRQLKLCIDVVADPQNLGISGVPRNLGKLDPSRFLEREGKKHLRFLLQSVVWQKIVEGFFSEPFGLGAMGRGEGREVLMRVVEGWRGLCGYGDGGALPNGKTASRSTTTSTDNNHLTPFFHSREANKWRSATFQSILMAVAPPSSSMSGNKSNSRKGQQQQQQAQPSPSSTPSPPDHPTTTTPYYANITQVRSQIVALLSSICSEPLLPEIESKISELARLAGELALQFGAQRAQLGLEVPKRGEQVKIGTESGWVDCEDGDSFGGGRGVEVEVDLCVSPKVYRVGDMDGRNMNMGGDKKGAAKVKAIVAGEVYPRRS